MCLHVQSHKLVHVSGEHCHTCTSFTRGCGFVYFIVQYHIEYSIFVSKPRMSGSKCKSSGDVAGTVLCFKRYCTIRLKMFSFFVYVFIFMYYLCEKHYIINLLEHRILCSITQYNQLC